MGVRNEQWHFFIGLPTNPKKPKIDGDTKDIIAVAAIDLVVSKSKDGKDAMNRKFVKYTAAYAKKKGVPRSQVDLTFEDKMLNAIKLIKERGQQNRLKIGFRKNSKENAKAEGNILGTYGHDTPVQKPRHFLGLTKKEIIAIVKAFAPEYSRAEILGAQTNPNIATT